MKAPEGKIAGWANIPEPKLRFTIIHPTRNRKEQALKTAYKWLTRADNTDEIEYIISIDKDDTDVWYHSVKMFANIEATKLFTIDIVKHENKSAIEAINNAARRATGGILIVVSDDFDCPEHWDTELLRIIGDRKDFLLKTDDGIQPTLVTLPIMDRVYYESQCYIYHPDYLHMFCDQELTVVAIMTGKYIKIPLTFQHMHYTTGLTACDDLNHRNNATWPQGEALFNEHLKTNFGIENPVVKYEEIQWR